MSVVKPEWFGISSCDDAWMIANTAAVSPYFFADLSCEGERLFGIVSRCARGNCQDTCETVLNACARQTLWRNLFAVQQELEATLGWTLTPRYVKETVPWSWGEHLQLSFGGVDRLNVYPDYWLHEAGITYDPFVYTVAATAPVSGSHYEILVPQWMLSKPEGAILVDVLSGDTVEYSEEVPGYPQARKVLGEWFWVLAIPGQQGTLGHDYKVLDCKWGIVEYDHDFTCIDPDTGLEVSETESALVYTDTFQKIPIERQETRTLPGEGSPRNFWLIQHRHMVREEYIGDEVDLTICDLDTHKLYPEVDAACFYERCQLVVVRTRCTKDGLGQCSCDDDICAPKEYDACATIVNGKKGIVAIERVELILDDDDEPVLDAAGCPTYRQCGDTVSCCEDPGTAYEVDIYYHTDPGCSGINNTSAIETLRRAIAARVAADSLLTNCGCEVECGWFKEMREELSTTRIAPGEMIVTLRYGNRRGQQQYAHALYTAPRNQRVGLL